MRLALALLLALAGTAQAKDYTTDPSSTLGFVGTYQGEKTTGKFNRFTARISLDKANLAAAKIEVEIDVTSATTGITEYDDELKGTKFFDFAKFPKAHFSSTTVKESGGALIAEGNLTIRDKTRPVQVKLDFKPAGEGATLDAQATLKRLDFDAGTDDYADTGIVGADVQVISHLVLK